MSATKKKIAAAIVALGIAIAAAAGSALSASAITGSGTATDPYVMDYQDLVYDWQERYLYSLKNSGENIGWFNIREAQREENGDTCVYKEAGLLSSTGEVLDLHVSRSLDTSTGIVWSNWSDLLVGSGGADPDKGIYGGGTCTYSIYATKAGTNTRVACKMGMLFLDIDQGWDTNRKEGVQVTTAHTSHFGIGAAGRVANAAGNKHGSWYGALNNPADMPLLFEGSTLSPYTSGDWVVYEANHLCGRNGGPYDGIDTKWPGSHGQGKNGDIDLDDSAMSFIAELPATGAYKIKVATALGGGGIGFDAFEFDPPTATLAITKDSTNSKSTKSPLCPEFYDLKGVTFTVKVKESDYFKTGVTMGTFTCNDSDGGACTVNASRHASTIGNTKLELPVGTYTITETISPTSGYTSGGTWTQNGTNKGAWSGTHDVVIGEDDDGDNIKVVVKNTPMARVVVEKVSNEMNNWTYGLATYSRAGAQYKIYNSETDARNNASAIADGRGSTYTNTLTTRYERTSGVTKDTPGAVVAGDGNYALVNPGGTSISTARPGVIEQSSWRVRSNVMMVAPGDYYMGETAVSTGYAFDTTAHSLAAKAGELTTVTSTEPPVEDPISIFKQDATYRALSASNTNPLCRQYLSDATNLLSRQRKQQIPQGDASLNGAQYRVTYYDGYYGSASAAASSGALQRTWTMKTATDATYGQGYSHLDIAHLVAGSGGLYYNAANAVTQAEATVPLGTIVVTEVRASDGYTLKNADLNDVYTYVVQVKKTSDTTTTANFVGQNYMSGTLDVNMNSRGELDSYNVVQRSDAWALKGDWAWRVMQEGYDLGHEWDMIYDNRVAATNPNPSSTVAGATFEYYNRSTYPVISPTDGKTIVPSGGKSASFERDRYSYHEDEDMVRVCIHEWRELNAASDVAQRVCAIVTDDLGYMSTSNKDGYHYHGDSNTWNVPATWTAALAYGSYEVRETVAPLEGYHLNQDYRGDVVARQDRVGRTESGVVSLNTDALKRNYGRYYVTETAKGTPVNEYLNWYTGDAVQWQFDYDPQVDAWVRTKRLS